MPYLSLRSRGVAQAVLRTTALLPANHNVVAVYLGDENYVSSTSSSLNDDSSPSGARIRPQSPGYVGWAPVDLGGG